MCQQSRGASDSVQASGDPIDKSSIGLRQAAGQVPHSLLQPAGRAVRIQAGGESRGDRCRGARVQAGRGYGGRIFGGKFVPVVKGSECSFGKRMLLCLLLVRSECEGRVKEKASEWN